MHYVRANVTNGFQLKRFILLVLKMKTHPSTSYTLKIKVNTKMNMMILLTLHDCLCMHYIFAELSFSLFITPGKRENNCNVNAFEWNDEELQKT